MNRHFGVGDFISAYSISGLPFNAVIAIAYSIPCYLLAGLTFSNNQNGDGSVGIGIDGVNHYFYFLAMIFVILIVFEAFASLVAALFENASLSVSATLVLFGAFIMFSGALHNETETLFWLRWIVCYPRVSLFTPYRRACVFAIRVISYFVCGCVVTVSSTLTRAITLFTEC